MKFPKFYYAVVYLNVSTSEKRRVITPLFTFLQASKYAFSHCNLGECVYSLTYVF